MSSSVCDVTERAVACLENRKRSVAVLQCGRYRIHLQQDYFIFDSKTFLAVTATRQHCPKVLGRYRSIFFAVTAARF